MMPEQERGKNQDQTISELSLFSNCLLGIDAICLIWANSLLHNVSECLNLSLRNETSIAWLHVVVTSKRPACQMAGPA